MKVLSSNDFTTKTVSAYIAEAPQTKICIPAILPYTRKMQFFSTAEGNRQLKTEKSPSYDGLKMSIQSQGILDSLHAYHRSPELYQGYSGQHRFQAAIDITAENLSTLSSFDRWLVLTERTKATSILRNIFSKSDQALEEIPEILAISKDSGSTLLDLKLIFETQKLEDMIARAENLFKNFVISIPVIIHEICIYDAQEIPFCQRVALLHSANTRGMSEKDDMTAKRQLALTMSVQERATNREIALAFSIKESDLCRWLKLDMKDEFIKESFTKGTVSIDKLTVLSKNTDWRNFVSEQNIYNATNDKILQGAIDAKRPKVVNTNGWFESTSQKYNFSRKILEKELYYLINELVSEGWNEENYIGLSIEINRLLRISGLGYYQISLDKKWYNEHSQYLVEQVEKLLQCVNKNEEKI